MRAVVVSLSAAAFALPLLGACPAMAWNCRGHEVVAAVAWANIPSEMKPRIAALLKLNPAYDSWTKNAGALDPTTAAFIQAACWPDDIKDDPNYHKGPPAGDPAGNQNIGYKDFWQHRDWHFEDIPFSPDGSPLPPTPTPNAETRIDDFRTALGSSAVDDVKSYDLTWLIHLVGDIHQPLHATTRATAAKASDTGGNDVCLDGPKTKFGCPELHAYWDDLLGSSRAASAAVHAVGTLKAAKPSQSDVDDTNVHDWATESQKLAISTAYAPPIGPALGPYDLTASPDNPAAATYRKNALATAHDRVMLAGLRLAKLIKDNLK